MAVILEIRPDASPEEKLRYLRDQIEMYLNGPNFIGREEIDEIIAKVISGGGGSRPSGTTNYNDLENKPSIEGVTLIDDKTFEQLNLNRITNSDIEDLLNAAEFSL